jgi:hypothetical protein
MNLYTSQFKLYGSSPHAVSIARRSPKWFDGRKYLSLAPSGILIGAFASGDIDEYDFAVWYDAEVLYRMTTRRITNNLKDGDILLCYEDADQFCHRHLVREWLNKNGIETEELRG